LHRVQNITSQKKNIRFKNTRNAMELLCIINFIVVIVNYRPRVHSSETQRECVWKDTLKLVTRVDPQNLSESHASDPFNSHSHRLHLLLHALFGVRSLIKARKEKEEICHIDLGEHDT